MRKNKLIILTSLLLLQILNQSFAAESEKNPEEYFKLGQAAMISAGEDSSEVLNQAWIDSMSSGSIPSAEETTKIMAKVSAAKSKKEYYDEAYKWFSLGAKKGNKRSMTSLGEMYSETFASTGYEDYVLAYMWYRVVGVKDDDMYIRDIRKKMTRSEVQEAKSLARKCKASNYQECY